MTDPNFYAAARFVSDRPADQDEFSSKAHERVAATLAQIITTSEGGRAIGLEGTWGSGKSTVIDIAARALESQRHENGLKSSVFVFDAWAHQGDPLRRVFLEELISKLSRDEAVDQEYWERELEKLRSKRKKTTEQKAEKLSPVAKAAVLTIPLYPLAYALILQYFIPSSGALATVAVPWLGSWPIWVFGLAIAAIPYVAALCVWLSWRRWGRPEWYKTREDKKGKSIVVAFTRQTDHIVTEQFIREDEATTVEFNEKFDELAESARFRKARIVIVLDNLDRLSQDQIKSIWGTMRNFFIATPGSSRHDALKNVWLIVPIDRRHIESVFRDGENEHSRRGFIEKTFEIVLRVPPPLLSNWEKFLKDKLVWAYGSKISDASIYKIYQFFDLYTVANPSIITPRALNTYVNDIVSQSKLSGNSIPLEYQALYSLYRQDVVHDISRLENSSVLDEAVKPAVESPDWAMYLAACHFNTKEPRQALELLLGQRIEGALAEADVGTLSELQQTGGFELILHQVVRRRAQEWAAEAPDRFFDVVDLVANLKFAQTAIAEHIWADFSRAVVHIGKPVSPMSGRRDSIRALLRGAPKSMAAQLAKDLAACLQVGPISVGSDAAATGVLWFGMMEAIANGLSEAGVANPKSVIGRLEVQSDIPFLFGVAGAAAGSTLLDFSAFAPSTPGADITTSISELLVAQVVPGNLPAIIRSFAAGNPKLVDWKAIIGGIQTRLQQNDPTLVAASASVLFDALRALAEQKNARAVSAMKVLADDGTLHGLLSIDQTGAPSNFAADVVTELILNRHAELAGPPAQPAYGDLGAINDFFTSWQAAPDDERLLVESVAQSLKPKEVLDWLLDLALDDNKDYQLFRVLARKLLLTAAPDELPLRKLWSRYSRLEQILDQAQIADLLAKIDVRKIDADLEGDGWKAVEPSFLRAIVQRKSSNARTIEEAIRQGLLAMTKDNWTAVLAGEANEVLLLLATVDLGLVPPLQLQFRDALQADTEAILEGRALPKNFGVQWQKLASILPAGSQESLFKWLRDQLINRFSNSEAIRKALALFGLLFVEKAEFAERGEDVVRTIVEPMIAGGARENLQAILDHSDGFRAAVNAASNDQRELLKARFIEVRANAEEGRSAEVQAVADALGISLPAAEAEPSKDEQPAEASKD